MACGHTKIVNGLKRSGYFLNLGRVNQFAQGHIDGLLVREILSAPFSKYDNVLFVVFAPSLLCSLWEGTDLPRKSPYRIVLTKQEQEELERRANKYTLPYFIVARAKMILLAAQGLANDEIANSLSTRREIVSRWRKRFFEKRLGGLADFPRPGRPRVFSPRAGRAR